MRAKKARDWRFLSCWRTAAFSGLLFGILGDAMASGVTIITHGHSSSIEDWIHAMALAMPGHPSFTGTNYSRYAIYVQESGSSFTLSQNRLSGGFPTNTDSGEIIVELDWRETANALLSDSTVNLAAAIVPRLLQTNFIPDLGGRPLVEFPLHFVGHSRGGSLVCEMSRLLGLQGVWVDHVTTLDPHPVNNDGFSDPLVFGVVDATARIYENVLFADNYYETEELYPHGKAITGAYSRFLSGLSGGYSSSHSDIHLWYHATIALATSVSDSAASIGPSERQNWWSAYEQRGTNAGFLYSRLGPGNRLSLDHPGAPTAAYIREGYNQRWDIGAGSLNNREPLRSNTGAWPNLLRLDLSGTNRMPIGATNSLTLCYQYGQPASSNATLEVWLDADPNSLNTNQWLLRQIQVPGTGTNAVSWLSVAFTPQPTNAPPGTYRLFGRITAASRARFLYAPQPLTLLPPADPVRLAIAAPGTEQVRIDVFGAPGQTVFLEGSSNLAAWGEITTHTLESNVWSCTVGRTNGAWQFYRARIGQ